MIRLVSAIGYVGVRERSAKAVRHRRPPLVGELSGSDRPTITKLFPPNYLIDVRTYPNRDAARVDERGQRQRLNEQFEDVRFFAYSDLGNDENWITNVDRDGGRSERQR
jgi:hypothetical protein